MSLSDASNSATARCAYLRRSFDNTFAISAADTIETVTDLLAVRLGADAYALRLSEVVGLHINLTVVPLPSPAPHLLGIAAIRGVMAPIYDLAALLGYPPAASARWIAVVGTPHMVGLALEQFESHVRVRDSLLNPTGNGDLSRAPGYSCGAVEAAGALRPVLQMSALIQLIREKTHDG